jgi:hypothetical protein
MGHGKEHGNCTRYSYKLIVGYGRGNTVTNKID